MSNIGKKPIILTDQVTVTVENDTVKVVGLKGSSQIKLPSSVTVEIGPQKLVVKKKNDKEDQDKFVGLARSLLSNMVTGVTSPFEKKLELIGVGYRARVDGDDLILNVGYTNPVRIKPTEGLKFSVSENVISISGIDKQEVGNIAHRIRSVRPPDPYKGKGIKYLNEVIRKKAGKSAKAVTGAK